MGLDNNVTAVTIKLQMHITMEGEENLTVAGLVKLLCYLRHNILQPFAPVCLSLLAFTMLNN